jgi:hypothetical protein
MAEEDGEAIALGGGGSGPHDGRGRWDLSGQLPTTLPAGTYYARVKAAKRTVGKFVCQADFSFMGVLGRWE